MLRPRRPVLLASLLLVASGVSALTTAAPAQAAPCDPPVTSPIACENTRPGNPESEWGVSGAGSSSIQGFATDISVDQGGTVGFKIDTPASSYRLDIYRMGYYGGDGARKVATVQPTTLNNQPNCITAPSTGLVDCGNWTQNASWTVPTTAVSGIYFARAVRTDGTNGASHIFFVVRDDDGGSELLFQTSDTTWQAYNAYGGNSLYTGSPAGRAYKVSYNRPFATRGSTPEDWVFNAEYPMVRFLESNGFDVSYSTGVDTDRRGGELTEHETFLSVGHDEYWSGQQRANVEAARAAGVNLAFFSGNEVFWKTRWENSIDGSGTSHRTLVTYKETHADAVIDPASPTWTGTWRDPRFSPPGDGGRPENALSGQIFTINCCAIDMRVGSADGNMRFWRNTRVANLTGNQTTTIGSNVIGYEWDEDLDNGHRPAGSFRLSETQGSGDRITDHGTNYSNAAATHSMTMYRHPSGSLVFGAGTIQWAWALDSEHDRGSAPADPAAQQATVNLLADMGAQPATPTSGLVAASASTDTTPPTSAITSPATDTTVPVGTPLTVSGTATDTGGGRVGGVEVSTNNGATWHRATGREAWTYTFTPSDNGPMTLRSRATDDSANTQVPGPGINVTAGSGAGGGCPCSIWPGTATPDRTDADTSSVELGVRFRAATDGFVTGIRYYKPAVSTGTHVGTLWTGTGTKLGSVTFTNESASGWQQATFTAPIPVTAGTTYVASYYTPSRYAVSSNYFANATTRGPLAALANGTDGGNGLYRYGSTAGAFPTNTYQSENYWVDVVFEDTDTTKPTVTGRTPSPGAAGVAVGINPTATFDEAVQQATIDFELRAPDGSRVPATTSYDAPTRRVTLAPNSSLAPSTSYTANLSGAKDPAGNQMNAVSWSFTTETPDTTKPSVSQRSPAPGSADVPVGAEVSAVFSEAVQESSIALTLRDPGGGAVAANVTYAPATRTVTLRPGTSLAASTTYTATLSGARDGAGNQMDPVSWSFTTAATDTTKPTVAARTPVAGATGVQVSSPVTVTFSEPVQQASIVLELRSPAGVLVPSATTYDASTRTARLTPNAALSGGTAYTAEVRGALDAADNRMDPVSWTFTTLASASGCPCSIWPDSATPQRTDPDRDAVELGVRFRAATDGFVTGIRFWKPVESTGTHTGSLWTNTGTRLATVTFTNETASGWQRATFASPVAVTAGTTYVASYHTPSRYAVTSNYLTSATTRGPLTALQDGTDGGNGLYRYSTTPGVFPNQTYRSENYWVDVDFVDTDTVKPGVSGRAPTPGATGVALGTTVSAVFDEPIDQTSILFVLRRPDGTAVPSTASYAIGSRTVTLTPDAALAATTTYTAHLSGARDAAGNHMDPVSWSFTTETPDTTSPTVTGRTPPPGATGVGVGARPTATFSEAVVPGSVSFELRTPTDTVVPATVAYDAGTRTVTLTPGAALGHNTTYTVRLTGTRDLSGNQMDPVSWTFTTALPDTTKPVAGGLSPPNGATGVATGVTPRVVFDEEVQQATIAFELRRPDGSLVPGTTTHAASTRTTTFTPGQALAAGTTYTARVSGARDVAGNQMDPVTWTFTTATSSFGCPCTIWPATAVPDRTDADTSSVELGVRFRASTDGFITGIRYYKPSVSTGTHVGTLWTGTGSKLSSVTFTNESASGWQQATLPAPVPVTAGTTYVASYFTPSRYAVSSDYFAGATTRGPLTALASGTDGGNGLYRYTGVAGTFPNNTYNRENYWIDVVFAESVTDEIAPTVTARVPSDASTGVPISVRPTVTFSEPVTPASIAMVLRTAGGQQVPASFAYDSGTFTATLIPTAPLAHSASYTVSVSGARDPAGNAMAATSWSFETAAPPPPPIDAGPGGPVAVVTSDANRSSSYLAEIARAEGLNEFSTVKNADLSAATLASYSAVVLGDVAVTDAQLAALSSWVDAGGNLILMRPDSRLLPLAGLTRATGTVADGYLRVDAATEPGAGITTETMQFHGTADRYSLAGATRVAELFTTATAGTGQPAVAWRSVGTNGGQVATFAYDLARSVIWTRQGNPAWAGTDRDGETPNRSNDLFFGGTGSDGLNLGKVAIPQADEQQRLLANLLTVMLRDRLPLPRFWYFPEKHKAVLVATGDDHAGGGTAGRMSTYTAASPNGCSTTRWECARFTSYVFPGSPITDGQAAAYHQNGFEIGLHPQNGCANYASLAELQGTYTSQLDQWAARYTSLPRPTTSRYHCIVWSDWASQPKAELASGIRLDTNYYFYPGSWIADRPGFMTGSGMPMRFTDTDGSLIDVYQATTQMTDESGQSYPFTPDTLLDRALGPLGYYGAFTANLHTDNATTFEDTQVLASAQERGVPVITARQLLTWLDGRNASSYSDIDWNGSTLGFNVNVGAGANQLSGMLPTTGPSGRTLSSITRGGTAVPYTLMTVKGQQYAVFTASSGAYTAGYGTGGSAGIKAVNPVSRAGSETTLAWRTEEPSSSTVLLGAKADDLSTTVTATERTDRHVVPLEDLDPGRVYHYRVQSTGPDGAVETWPAKGRPPARFTTAPRDQRPPRVSAVRAFALPDGTARVSWRSDEPATSVVRWGRGARRLVRVGRDADLRRTHTVVLTGLAARRGFAFRVESSDRGGNTARGPVRRLRTPPEGVAMQTVEDFRTGRWSSGLVVDDTRYGSLRLAAPGHASYTSRVLDSGTKSDWLRAVLRSSSPPGTSVTVRTRVGNTAWPDRTWSAWSTPRDDGDLLRQSGRYLQYRVVLAASGPRLPVLRAVGFTRARMRTDHTQEH